MLLNLQLLQCYFFGDSHRFSESVRTRSRVIVIVVVVLVLVASELAKSFGAGLLAAGVRWCCLVEEASLNCPGCADWLRPTVCL